jgi:hypothetical protein
MANRYALAMMAATAAFAIAAHPSRAQDATVSYKSMSPEIALESASAALA